MKIIVTGGTGFIGREILFELEKTSCQVIGIGNKTGLNAEIINEGLCNYFQADITDYSNLFALEKIEGVDAIVHAAGLAHQFKEIERKSFNSVNVQGTINILELALRLKVGHFVLISSTAVYGLKDTYKQNSPELQDLEINEMSACEPETFYAQSKLEAELAAIEICEKNNLPLTILRVSPVIGEGNVGNVARLIETIDKKRFVWIGKGENYKTLIYKKDVARACRRILEAKKNRTEIFNLAADPILMNEFVEIIAENLKRKILKIRISPQFLELIFRMNTKLFGIRKIRTISKTVEKWLSDDVYSAKKIAEVYGFKPETSIRQALEKQIRWYKKSKKEKIVEK